MKDEPLCNICTDNDTQFRFMICAACLRKCERLVKNKKTTKSDSCILCSPLLQIPGTPLFTVVIISGIPVCVMCIAKERNSKKVIENGECAQVIQFPTRKNFD